MFEKLKWWLKRGKKCKGFCPLCEFYDNCKDWEVTRDGGKKGKSS